MAQSIAKVIGADKREDGYLEGKSVRLSVKVVFQEKRYSLQANSGYRIMDMNQRKKVSKHLLEN